MKADHETSVNLENNGSLIKRTFQLYGNKLYICVILEVYFTNLIHLVLCVYWSLTLTDRPAYICTKGRAVADARMMDPGDCQNYGLRRLPELWTQACMT